MRILSPLFAVLLSAPFFAFAVPASTEAPAAASVSPAVVSAAEGFTVPSGKELEALQLEVRALIKILEEYHYNRDAVRPASYSEVIPNTLRAFDGQKLFFLGSDLAELQEKNRPESLYWNLTAMGRLDPAFEIFALYQKRVRERITWVKARLPGDIDLTANETYELDRRELDWPADAAAADALWERRLKFEILQEVLNKKTMDEARVTVGKRYDRLGRNSDDFAAGDVTEAFLSAISGLYDPHSTYFSPDTYEDFGINIRLQLFGVGALLGIEDDICVLKEIIPGGPADLGRQLPPAAGISASEASFIASKLAASTSSGHIFSAIPILRNSAIRRISPSRSAFRSL